MGDDDLTNAAKRLSTILGDHALLIGGLAVSAWGHVRATEDIDFVSRLEPEEIRDRLKTHDIATDLKRGDVLGGDIPWVVHGKVGRIDFQVLPPLVAITWEDAERVSLPDGSELRVVSLRDLLRLKIHAGGPRDLWDVAELLRIDPELRDDARKWAAAEKKLDELDSWLNDPRLGAP